LRADLSSSVSGYLSFAEGNRIAWLELARCWTDRTDEEAPMSQDVADKGVKEKARKKGAAKDAPEKAKRKGADENEGLTEKDLKQKAKQEAEAEQFLQDEQEAQKTEGEPDEDLEDRRRRYLLKRFWQTGSQFWRGDARRKAWFLTISLLITIAVQLIIQYELTVWNRTIFDALEKKDGAAGPCQDLVFPLLAAGTAT